MALKRDQIHESGVSPDEMGPFPSAARGYFADQFTNNLFYSSAEVNVAMVPIEYDDERVLVNPEFMRIGKLYRAVLDRRDVWFMKRADGALDMYELPGDLRSRWANAQSTILNGMNITLGRLRHRFLSR